ncbi:MAG TPA: hypothetical protein VGJ18_18930 [Gemmatimonadaceae bacterium]|jgi:hypothetical protein
MSKHAVMGFHESLLSELLHDGNRVRTTMVQMPAMNTPQFDWVKSRLPNKSEPVPPIFQPEVGAEAVFYAAHHDVGRELLVGWPTVKAVFANKFVPAYIDRRLAADGYESQQTGEPPMSRGPTTCSLRHQEIGERTAGSTRARGRAAASYRYGSNATGCSSPELPSKASRSAHCRDITVRNYRAPNVIRYRFREAAR